MNVRLAKLTLKCTAIVRPCRYILSAGEIVIVNIAYYFMSENFEWRKENSKIWNLGEEI